MIEKHTATKNGVKYNLSTDQFSARHMVKGQSVRAQLCRTGSYLGVRPMKLANGRLLWPDIYATADGVEVQQPETYVVSGAAKGTTA